jgi:hypothetical protein
MPRRNRVTPFGDIVVDAGRGTLMGNRGVLHDAEQRIVRDSQVRRWIACRLEFRGRWRPIMQPGHWTELFFLDEAAAFAAGHRPCAECRLADYLRFKQAWCQAVADARDTTPSADAIDRRLHAERRLGPWRKRTYTAEIATLPDGTYVALDGRAWLVLSEWLLEWSAGGYLIRRPRVSRGDVTVLTPPSLVAAIAAGYGPSVHHSSRC